MVTVYDAGGAPANIGVSLARARAPMPAHAVKPQKANRFHKHILHYITKEGWRRRADLNRRITVLQTVALGHLATPPWWIASACAPCRASVFPFTFRNVSAKTLLTRQRLQGMTPKTAQIIAISHDKVKACRLPSGLRRPRPADITRPHAEQHGAQRSPRLSPPASP